jgi:hypothetical protein
MKTKCPLLRQYQILFVFCAVILHHSPEDGLALLYELLQLLDGVPRGEVVQV